MSDRKIWMQAKFNQHIETTKHITYSLKRTAYIFLGKGAARIRILENLKCKTWSPSSKMHDIATSDKYSPGGSEPGWE